jgi:hypothetical protein
MANVPIYGCENLILWIMTILVVQVNMMASAMMQTSSGTGTVSDLAPGKHLQFAA